MDTIFMIELVSDTGGINLFPGKISTSENLVYYSMVLTFQDQLPPDPKEMALPMGLLESDH
jgi:hypothetical protein